MKTNNYYDPNRVDFKAGPVEVKGRTSALLSVFGLISAAGLAVYAGFRWIKKSFDEPEVSTKPKDTNQDKGDGTHEEPSKPLASETLAETLNKADRPAAKLIGGLISPGDRVFLFSTTNQGKSTLSMELGLDIASGRPSKIVAEDEPHAPQRVIVYDSEQSDQDILNRYGEYGDLPKNLKRVPDCTFNSVSDLIKDIELQIQGIHEDTTFVLDNLTNICPRLTPESARQFHESLKKLQTDFHQKGHLLTFVIVGHTVKTDPYGKPSINDISGSSNLANFATSVYALWPTCYGEDHKMLVPLKARNFKKDGTVLVLRLVEEHYLHFEYVRSVPLEDAMPIRSKRTSKDNTGQDSGTSQTDDSSDSNHNKEVTEEDVERMKQLQQDGMSYREIGEELGVSKKTVCLYIQGKRVPKKKA